MTVRLTTAGQHDYRRALNLITGGHIKYKRTVTVGIGFAYYTRWLNMAVFWMRSTNRGKAYILQPLADNDDVSISTCMNATFSVKTLNNKNNKRTA